MSMVSNDKHIFGVLFVARLLGGLVFLFGEDFFVSFLCLSFLFLSIFGLVVFLPPLGKDTTLISFLIFTLYFNNEGCDLPW